MDLSQHLSPDLILLAPKVKDKWELLERMAEAIHKGPFGSHCPPDAEAIFNKTVLEREHDRTTAMGGGFAMPHGRIPGLSCYLLCMALLPDGLDFDAPDGEPVKVVCMILTPATDPTFALKVMGSVAQLFRLPDTRRELEQSKTPIQAYKVIEARRPKLELSICAKDIMRRPTFSMRPETPLREVTRFMLEGSFDAVPIVTEDGTLVGEISCDLLFQRGIPDFFGQLTSVSFIKHFDPFEGYFAEEAEATAKDVMSTDYSAMPETATLLEVVFALSVKKHPKVYVVRDGKAIGVIDRALVLDRILNL